MLGETGPSGVSWAVAAVTTKPAGRRTGRLFVTPRAHTYLLVCLEMLHGHGVAEAQKLSSLPKASQPLPSRHQGLKSQQTDPDPDS